MSIPAGKGTTFTPQTQTSFVGNPISQKGTAAENVYAVGQEGTFAEPPHPACTESAAVAAGSAVTLNTTSKLCLKLQGITIPIGPTYSTIDAFAQLVNLNFDCNGNAGAATSNLALA